MRPEMPGHSASGTIVTRSPKHLPLFFEAIYCVANDGWERVRVRQGGGNNTSIKASWPWHRLTHPVLSATQIACLRVSASNPTLWIVHCSYFLYIRAFPAHTNLCSKKFRFYGKAPYSWMSLQRIISGVKAEFPWGFLGLTPYQGDLNHIEVVHLPMKIGRKKPPKHERQK
jgi:hypothetical protein